MDTRRTYFFRKLGAGLALGVGMIFLSINVSSTYAFNDNSPIVTGWSEIGMLGASDIGISYAYNLQTAFAPDGTPYVAFSNGDDQRVSVMKFAWGVWSVVGSAGISDADVADLVFTIAPDGTPYVAYTNGTGGADIVVKEYSGGIWNTVVWSGDVAPWSWIKAITVAADGTIYIVHRDDNIGGFLSVAKYSGGIWSTEMLTEASIWWSAIAIAPDGTPYVAYIDNDNSSKATVMKYSGGAWSVVGDAGFSTSVWNPIAITIAPDGTPYTTVVDGVYAYVMKYSGGAWSVVGDAGFSTSNTSTPAAVTTAPDGTPYVAYRDSSNGDKATVMKYSDGAWNMVGTAGFSSRTVGLISILVTSDGIPYILYVDPSVGRGLFVAMKHAIPVVGTVQGIVPKNLTFRKATLSNASQYATSSGGVFKIADTKGSAAGYYATLSASDLTDTNGNTIPSANIYATTIGSTMRTFSWSTNASVVAPSTEGTVGAGWVSLDNPTTIIERNNDGGGIFGTYGINPIIRVTIPPYTPVGSYRGSFTFTLIEN